MVGRIRPDLGFETEAGKGAVTAALEAGDGDVQLCAGIELHAGLGRQHFHRDTRIDAAS
ncbi:hypothetical protein D3C78_1884150 [compost metagenome]